MFEVANMKFPTAAYQMIVANVTTRFKLSMVQPFSIRIEVLIKYQQRATKISIQMELAISLFGY